MQSIQYVVTWQQRVGQNTFRPRTEYRSTQALAERLYDEVLGLGVDQVRGVEIFEETTQSTLRSLKK